MKSEKKKEPTKRERALANSVNMERIVCASHEGVKVFAKNAYIRTNGECLFSVVFKDETNNLTDLEANVATMNLINEGGYDRIKTVVAEFGKYLEVSAIYGGVAVESAVPTTRKQKKDEYFHSELTIADLVKFVKANPDAFPLGMKTKMSLGDYEGNTYHRKMSLGGDDGRLYISYELNENADEEKEVMESEVTK